MRNVAIAEVAPEGPGQLRIGTDPTNSGGRLQHCFSSTAKWMFVAGASRWLGALQKDA